MSAVHWSPWSLDPNLHLQRTFIAWFHFDPGCKYRQHVRYLASPWPMSSHVCVTCWSVCDWDQEFWSAKNHDTQTQTVLISANFWPRVQCLCPYCAPITSGFGSIPFHSVPFRSIPEHSEFSSILKKGYYIVDIKCTKSAKKNGFTGLNVDMVQNMLQKCNLCYIALLALCYNLENVLSYYVRYKLLCKYPSDRSQPWLIFDLAYN